MLTDGLVLVLPFDRSIRGRNEETVEIQTPLEAQRSEAGFWKIRNDKCICVYGSGVESVLLVAKSLGREVGKPPTESRQHAVGHKKGLGVSR